MVVNFNSPGHANEEQVAMATKGRPTILILSLLHNSEKHLPTFNHLLNGLTYPKSLISVVFGEEKSIDNTVNITYAMLNEMVRDYRRVGIHSLQVNSGFTTNTAESHHANYKHSMEMQYERRRHIALARNVLLSHGLKDEDWVLWLDSDIEWVPNDLIEHMLWAKKDILVPRCAIHGKTWESLYDLNTWRESEESRRWQSVRARSDFLLLEGYGQPRPDRLHLDSLRNEGDIVEVDGVGGCVLLVNSLLHRHGLNFPAFVYKNQIETEGFARMAQSMGHKLWALPRLTVYHSCSNESTWVNCNE
ncbi:uncharacterized protein LOC135485609 [Lineus longissimus]|uniref:uncharacterized protein LOC135485609 n=1 Tax=Lineus longissimus TaxID=88925 RepID=UPI00315C6257